MICPFCAANDDKVIDSRSTESGKVIRRRRQCLDCQRRFTTYERVEQTGKLLVIKKDARREPFDRDKVAAGIAAAIGKRPVPDPIRKKLVDEIDEQLHAQFEREVPSRVVGEHVMAALRRTDSVAYIRFATEHLELQSLKDIKKELDDLMSRPVELPNQEALFTSE